MSKVIVQPSGVEFDVEPGETLLEAAERNGLDFPFRCRNGVCTACVCKQMEGKVSYADRDEQNLALSSSSGQLYVYCCIAYPLSDLVIHHPFIK